VKNIISTPKDTKKEKKVQVININKESTKANIQKKDPDAKSLSEEEKVKISEILKRIRINTEK
jgi:hypothetical protein